MIRQIFKQLGRHVDTKFNTGAKRSICSTMWLRADATEAAKRDPVEKQNILVDKQSNITLIGINRPQHRNAINSKTATQLCDAIRAFEADDTSPVAVLYGVGGSFCAGFDIFELGNEGEEQVSIELLMMPEGSVGPTRRHLLKPVVCSINGYCVANGLELALMCDLRVMEESAVLGFFNRRFGVPVIDGGTARLPAMIGLSRALDLILTGRPVKAEEAQQMGIVNRVVETGTSLNQAIELAHTLAKYPQSALIHDRNSVYSAVFDVSSFNAAIQNEIMYTSKNIIEQMQDGIKWFNKTFKSDTRHYWFKKEWSMADWDDQDVAAAADKIEEAKKAKEVARIEEERKVKEEKEREKQSKKSAKNEKETKAKGEQDSESKESIESKDDDKRDPKN